MLREIKEFNSREQYLEVKAALEKGFASRELRKPPVDSFDFKGEVSNESSYEFYEDKKSNKWILIPPENGRNGSLRLYKRAKTQEEELEAFRDARFKVADKLFHFVFAIIVLALLFFVMTS